MTDHETTLARLLARAAQHKMTPAEIEAQRRSFARAEAGFGSDADEAAYRAALVRGDEPELRRLRRQADERVRRAEEIMNGW